jgi:hypothetical protein
MKLLMLNVSIVVLLAGCSGQSTSHRHFKKQNSPSTIKIASLDLEKKSIQLRFDYRSHNKKILKNMDCEIKLNSQSTLSIKQIDSIELGAFSTETLGFKMSATDQTRALMNLQSIDYDINCYLKYNKGSEYLSESSVLHLTPSEKFIYR